MITRVVLTVLAAAAVAAPTLVTSGAATAATGDETTWVAPPFYGDNGPDVSSLAAGGDGSLYADDGGRLVRIGQHDQSSYLTTAYSTTVGAVTSFDGTVWATASYSTQPASAALLEVTPSGSLVTHPLPAPPSSSDGFEPSLVSSNGTVVWFYAGSNTFGVYTISTGVTDWLDISVDGDATSLIAMPDGTAYINDTNAGIQHATQTGAVTPVSLPHETRDAVFALGPDGHAWYVDGDTAVMRITGSSVSVQPLPQPAGTTDIGFTGLTLVHGRFWLAAPGRVESVVPSGAASSDHVYWTGTTSSVVITAGPGDAVWSTDGGSMHRFSLTGSAGDVLAVRGADGQVRLGHYGPKGRLAWHRLSGVVTAAPSVTAVAGTTLVADTVKGSGGVPQVRTPSHGWYPADPDEPQACSAPTLGRADGGLLTDLDCVVGSPMRGSGLHRGDLLSVQTMISPSATPTFTGPDGDSGDLGGPITAGAGVDAADQGVHFGTSAKGLLTFPDTGGGPVTDGVACASRPSSALAAGRLVIACTTSRHRLLWLTVSTSTGKLASHHLAGYATGEVGLAPRPSGALEIYTQARRHRIQRRQLVGSALSAPHRLPGWANGGVSATDRG